jgi:putative flippase GtrA
MTSLNPESYNGLIGKLTSHIPPAQFSRYLLVGLWNTAVGYGSYAGFTVLLTPHIAHAYIVASVVANFLTITVAFLAYKWFVFKTKGNYLREWLRCVTVYGGAALLGTLLLPLLVFALRHLTRFDASAPYIAGAALLGLSAIISFLGHKNFSFAGSRPVRD